MSMPMMRRVTLPLAFILIFGLLWTNRPPISAARIHLGQDSVEFSHEKLPSELNRPTDWKASQATNGIRVPTKIPLAGHYGGVVSSPHIVGDLAYLGVGNELWVFDVSDRSDPVPMDVRHSLPGIIEDIVIAGDKAYIVSNGYGLHIVDLSNPATPNEIGYLPTNASPYALEVAGNVVYLVTGRGLTIVDVTNAQAPAVLGTMDTPGSGAFDLAIARGYAFVVDMDKGLHVVNISTPEQPTIVATVDTPGYVQGVAIVDDYAYLADVNEGLRIIDISVPSNPVEIGFYEDSSIRSVNASGTHSYFASNYALWIVDASNPHSPFIADVVSVPGAGGEVALADGYAYVAGSNEGLLQVVDVMTPDTATLVGVFDNFVGQVYESTLSDQTLYTITGNKLEITDISDPEQPVSLDSILISSCNSGIALIGDYAYVSSGTFMTVVDVSVPSDVREVDHLSSGLSSMKMIDNYVYGIQKPSQQSWNLAILDVTDPAQSTFVSTTPLGGYAGGLSVLHSYAFVARGYDGLQAIDVSDPAEPVAAGIMDTPGFAMGVDVKGNFAYVADLTEGLRVVDISNPDRLVEVGFLHTPGYSYDVAVAGDYAFVAGDSSGVFVVDVSVPGSPVAVASYNTPGRAQHVAIDGNDVVVSDMEGGIYSFRWPINPPTNSQVFLPAVTKPEVVSTFENEVVDLVNAERAAVGCVPLSQDAQLDAAAEGHSRSMALDDFYSHTGLEGSSHVERITRTGYRPYISAENIAAGQPSPTAVVDGWMNSPTHRDNILNCDFQEIGVGYYYQDPDPGNVTYKHYWTQVFASP